VAQWLEDADDDKLYFSVVSIGEILKGLRLFQKVSAETSFSNGSQKHSSLVQRPNSPVNEPVAERWGWMAGNPN